MQNGICLPIPLQYLPSWVPTFELGGREIIKLLLKQNIPKMRISVMYLLERTKTKPQISLV